MSHWFLAYKCVLLQCHNLSLTPLFVSVTAMTNSKHILPSDISEPSSKMVHSEPFPRTPYLELNIKSL